MSELKAGRFGKGVSVEQVLIEAMHCEYESVVVIGITKDDFVESGWSELSSLKRIGMLETAKDAIIRSQREAAGDD